MFLDDDDMFSTNNSLQLIVNNIINDNTFIYWHVKLGSKIIYPPDINKFTDGQIASNGFCFHSKYKGLSRWECRMASDYTFVKRLLESNTFLYKDINEVLTQTQHNMMGLNGEKETILFNEIINKYEIKQIYVSKSLEHLKTRIYKIYGLSPYNSVYQPCIFFGKYDRDDDYIITNHKSMIYAMPGGSDTLSYNNIKHITNIKFFSLSNDMKYRLLTIGINSEIVDFNLVDEYIFKPVKTFGHKVFIYDGIRKKPDNAIIYGKILHDEVRKKLPQYEYIYSSELGLPYEKMPEIYAQCFIGLRLTPHDGNANMVQEMKSMNIPVVHNQSEYGLKWKNVDDVVNYITNISEKSIEHNKQTEILLLDIDMYALKKVTEKSLSVISENINSFYNFCKKYKNILFICGDYPGYGGAATNCDKLQKFFINKGHNTYSFYYNFETGENAVYKKTNITCIDDIKSFTKIMTNVNFKPDLVILKSFINVDLKCLYKCPLIYLVGGIYKNSLDKYYYNIDTKTEQDKYINYSVLNQIKNSDYIFVNSSHTKSILEKFYNVKTQIFYSTFIEVYDKNIEIDDNFNNRKYEYGLIVSNFNRTVKNIDESISFLKDKQNVILIGKNSSNYKKYGFECIELVEPDKMTEYYNQIKYIQQDSFYESCSNVKIEALFNGCKIKPVIVVSSTQYPGYGGAATNAYNIIKYLRMNGFKVCGVFFHLTLNVNVDPDNIGGIFIYNVNNMKYNYVKEQVIHFLGNMPDICLCKNYKAPLICKNIFNCYIVYLVSGISFFNNNKNITAEDFLNVNFSINDIDTNMTEIESINASNDIVCNSSLSRKIFNKLYPFCINKINTCVIDTSSMVINNVYDIDIYDTKKDIDIIFCCSNMSRMQKNTTFIKELLYNELLDKYKKVIIGSECNKYFDIIKSIQITGLIPQKDCIEYMKRSKLILVPSNFDSNPNICKEALHANCLPIITKNIGCYDKYPQILICNSLNIEVWSEKIIYLLSNYDNYKNICKSIQFDTIPIENIII